MSKEPQLWHTGIVKHNDFNSITFDKPLWLRNELGLMIGKKVRVLIEEIKIEKTPPQLALYFGVIIKMYCMKDEQFGGWTERDIDNYFRTEITGYTKTVITKDGLFNRMIPCVDDIRLYSKEQMSKYIDTVLNLLADRHDITIDDPYLFKLNKYSQDI